MDESDSIIFQEKAELSKRIELFLAELKLRGHDIKVSPIQDKDGVTLIIEVSENDDKN